MDLDRELVMDIKELDQKRELTAIILIHVLSHNLLKISLHHIAESIAGKPSFAYDRILYAHICNLPTLAYQFVRRYRNLVIIFIQLDKLLTELLHQIMTTPRPL